jgi:hypothetical protein
MRIERWTSPAGKQRLLTTLDRAESRSYAAAVRLALPERVDQPRAVARHGPGHPRPPWYEQRRVWRASVRSRVAHAQRVVLADIADCYPSITHRAIESAASLAGGDPGPLLVFLDGLREGGVRGLPIGPHPSMRVAEAILTIADERAGAAGAPPIRWVDDVVFAGDRDDVARAHRAWRSALADLGLREHEGKRREFRDPNQAIATIVPRVSLGGRGEAHGIMRTS